MDVDAMTRATSERKKLVFKAGPDKEKPSLTPVGTEKGAFAIPEEVPGVFLTREALRDAAKDLRRQAQLLIDVADGLDQMTLTERAPTVAPEEAIKAAERAADEKFSDRFARLSREAQAAAYGGDLAPAAREVFADDIKPAASGSARPGWNCPEHGALFTEDRKSPRGRNYRACTQCAQFEK